MRTIAGSMLKQRRAFLALTILSLSIVTVSVSHAQQATLPEPDKIVRQMCDYLKSLKQFSYQAEVSYDEADPEGDTVQYSIHMETSVRRPDRLRVNAEGDMIDKQFFFNGRTITLYDRNHGVYAAMDVPPDIEAALDKAHKDFDLRVALTDLASPKLYEHLSIGQRGPQLLGLHKVGGVSSYHLVFDRGDIRLQVWIAAGQKPLPRKVVITEKKQPGSPQWTAYLNHWNVAPKLKEPLFTFVAPPGVQRITFLAVHEPASSRPDSPPSQKGDRQ